MTGEREGERPGTVRLTVPADTGFLPLLRLTGSAIASRSGFSVDGVDDIRIAVDELVAIAVGCAEPDSELTVEFVVGDRHVVADGRAKARPDAGRPELSELSAKILEAVVDVYDIGLDAERGEVQFRFEKRGDRGAA